MTKLQKPAQAPLARMRQFRAKLAAEAQALSDQRFEFQNDMSGLAAQICRDLDTELQPTS